MTDRENINDPHTRQDEPPKQKLLFEPSKFNPPARLGGFLMLATGLLLLKYELLDIAQAAPHLDDLHFQPLYSMLGGVLVALGALCLVFGQWADQLLGRKERDKLPARWLLWILILAPGLVAWGYDVTTMETRKAPADAASTSDKAVP